MSEIIKHEKNTNQKNIENSDSQDNNEITHWADRIVDEILERVRNDATLKKMVDKHGFIVMDEKTPSGEIHIGSGRGWVIHDVVAKAFRDRGLKSKFILSSDDIDPFDKWNSDLDPKFKKYLGEPFMNIPSPDSSFANSFAEYYFKRCTDRFTEFGIDAELESTGAAYKRGDFNATIKTALDRHEKIQEIFKSFYGDDVAIAQKLPFNPICEKCGKIATTVAYEWDAKKEKVKYRCEKNTVKYVEGCGHTGEISPYNGAGKLPWKVEWAAKWPTFHTIFETAGKDHFTKNGSRDVAIVISDKVYDFPPPYPSTRTEMGKGYEFFHVGGKKMSTSKGQGISFAESTKFAPARILRYLLVRSRPHAVIDFSPSEKNDIILLYDRYDKTERMYYGVELDENEQENLKAKRIYELSCIGKIPDKMPLQVPFLHCAVVMQTAFTVDKALEVLRKTGHISIDTDISDEELAPVIERLQFAMKWVKEFAPEQYVFALNNPDNVTYRPDSETKRAVLRQVRQIVDNSLDSIDEKELHNIFYNICTNNGLDIKEFFSMMYEIIVSKNRGPKLASFIQTIGKEKVLALLDKSLNK